MNISLRLSIFAAFAAASNSLVFSEDHSHHNHGSAGPILATAHAPIGVMGDHPHAKGEWMISLRTMSLSMEGHRAGEDRLTTHQVFQRGFGAAALSMDMDMQMLGLMYAPNDRVTLMAMSNYMEMDMTMMSDPNAMGGGHGDHGGHGGAGAGPFSHSTSGWGDVTLSSLIRIGSLETSRWHLNLGFSAPTGSVEEKMGTVFQPYGMQLGSGTWDAKVGATYSNSGERFSWGGQAIGTKRLESKGASGFARADALEASAWLGWEAARGVGLSGRIKYTAEGALSGHYNGSHSHSAPPHFQANYGGDIVEALFGVNYVFQDGALRGHRLAFEYGLPVYQQLNGVGMNREDSWTIGWQKAW